MRPRSSRSHSTHVPADSMMASTPHVFCRPVARRRWGRSPPRLAALKPGRPVAHAQVEHAPGPEGGLGRPGRRAPLPDERRLLVPGDPADDRRARQMRPPRPRRPTSPRSPAARRVGIAQRRRAPGVVPPRPVAAQEPGDPGVGGVGDVQGASRQRPRHPGVDRAEAQVAPGSGRDRPCRAASPAWWHDSLGPPGCPVACSSRHVPTVRRSCQPMPGPPAHRWHGPTRRSDARWLAIAHPCDRSRGPTGLARATRARPSPWRWRRTPRARARATTGAPPRDGRGRWRRRAAPHRLRTPEVPTSTTRIRSRPRGLTERARAGPACLD